VRFIATVSARQFSEAEDLASLTLFGTTAEVLERDLQVAPRRAAKLGLTVSNGGVYIYDAIKEFPELKDKYTEKEVNAVRTFGLEKTVLFVGKRVLIVQKAMVDEADQEDAPEGESLQFDDGRYVTGNVPGTVIGWKAREYVEVKVDRRPDGANQVKVRVEVRNAGDSVM
jgi:hypothetical protein